MARPKTKVVEERKDVSVALRLLPYYAISFDHPMLRGTVATGATPAQAMTHARALLATRFPHGTTTLTVTESNPETFTKAGVHFVQD